MKIIIILLTFTITTLAETIFLGPTDLEGEAFTTSLNGHKGFYVIHDKKIYWYSEKASGFSFATITKKENNLITFTNHYNDNQTGKIELSKNKVIFHYANDINYPMKKLPLTDKVLKEIEKTERKETESSEEKK